MENLVNISWSKPYLGDEELDLVSYAMRSTWVSGGEYVESFEKELAKILDVKHIVSVNNGTSALLLALVSVGLKAGDTVIVPAFGFMAAANVSKILNLKIVFADVYENSWNIDLNSISKSDLMEASAVIAIDSYGNPCNMDEILEFAAKYDLKIIQDCAESIGSKIAGKYAGTFESVGTFSFHATKLITTGEGGAIATNNDGIAKFARLYRSHGMDRQIDYLHKVPGNNLRLSNILAAIGVAQLRNFDYFRQSRMEIDTKYRELFKTTLNLNFQTFDSDNDVVPWSFPVLLGAGKEFRDSLQQKMKSRGIETRTGFKSPKYIEYFKCSQKFHNADRLSENILSLPAYPGIKNEEINFIADVLLGYL